MTVAINSSGTVALVGSGITANGSMFGPETYVQTLTLANGATLTGNSVTDTLMIYAGNTTTGAMYASINASGLSLNSGYVNLPSSTPTTPASGTFVVYGDAGNTVLSSLNSSGVRSGMVIPSTAPTAQVAVGVYSNGVVHYSTLPTPTLATLGGVYSNSASGANVMVGIVTSGNPLFSPLPMPTFTTLGGVYANSGVGSYYVSGLNTSGQLLFTILPSTSIPTPTSTTLGGVYANSGVTYKVVTGLSTTGALTFGYLPTPTTTTLGGVYANSGVTYKLVSGIDTTGTLTYSYLPTPTTSTLGGVYANSGITQKVVSGIDTTGTLTYGYLPAPTASYLGGVVSGSGTFMTGITTSGTLSFGTFASSSDINTGSDNTRPITSSALAGVLSGSLAASGWYKHPGGWLVQWGKATGVSSAGVAVSFTVSFTSVYSVTLTPDFNITAVSIGGLSTSGFTAYATTTSGCWWIAIGHS